MKRRAWLLISPLVLSACGRGSDEPAEAYQRWPDQMIVRLGLPSVGIWPCRGHTETENGIKVEVSPPIDECYKMQPPRRWRGIWVTGPGEHDEQFCPGSNGACPLERRPSYTFMWNQEFRPEKLGESPGRYAVDFIGRRTTYPLEFNFIDHRYVIVIDHMNGWKALDPPPNR